MVRLWVSAEPFTHLLPLTIVSILSYVVADLLKSTPIYESLLANQVAEKGITSEREDSAKKVTFETVVHHGSPAEDKLVRDLNFPSNCLLIAVRRNRSEFIPKGTTKLQAGDYLVLLTDVKTEAVTREKLDFMSSTI